MNMIAGEFFSASRKPFVITSLSSHFGHDLRPVNQEEKSSSLISYGGNKSLARPRAKRSTPRGGFTPSV